MREHCLNCGNPILVAIFKGTDWCSERCRKILAKEIFDTRWQNVYGFVREDANFFDTIVEFYLEIWDEHGLVSRVQRNITKSELEAFPYLYKYNLDHLVSQLEEMRE